ncbi:MAG: hypothetical protein Q7U64_05040 [Desulfocapsaceae bacterium]|nr:hypothetical protein [Desulfocapsaceae bacterium]
MDSITDETESWSAPDSPDLPSGPTIVMLAGFFYLAVIVGKVLKNRLR